MEKEFIPYEQALALKELGFDEPCIACYDKLNMLATYSENLFEHKNYNTSGYCVSAPLYQQAFRWFREKYDIFGYCYIPNESGYWGHSFENKAKYDTYKEAELEFLKELIEIVKNL